VRHSSIYDAHRNNAARAIKTSLAELKFAKPLGKIKVFLKLIPVPSGTTPTFNICLGSRLRGWRISPAVRLVFTATSYSEEKSGNQYGIEGTEAPRERRSVLAIAIRSAEGIGDAAG